MSQAETENNTARAAAATDEAFPAMAEKLRGLSMKELFIALQAADRASEGWCAILNQPRTQNKAASNANDFLTDEWERCNQIVEAVWKESAGRAIKSSEDREFSARILAHKALACGDWPELLNAGCLAMTGPREVTK